MKRTVLFLLILLSMTGAEVLELQQGDSYQGCSDATIVSASAYPVTACSYNFGDEPELGLTFSMFKTT